MYHPGKVIEVLKPKDKGIVSADASVQAVLRMWDEHVLTMLVSPKIAGKIKAGQIVLVDYRPQKDMPAPVPAHIITKILEGKKAGVVWRAYSEAFERKKRSEQGKSRPPAQSYIG